MFKNKQYAYEKDYEHKVVLRKVLRGGCWGGTSEGCRVSRLDFDTAKYSDEYGGFRLAMDTDTVQIVSNAIL